MASQLSFIVDPNYSQHLPLQWQMFRPGSSTCLKSSDICLLPSLLSLGYISGLDSPHSWMVCFQGLYISTAYTATGTMSATNFCCTHPQQRIDSPEPPARPLAAIDGIFAAAVLPPDHPHALKMLDRKPETDPDIVKSPGIASKIKMQFRRRSMKNLGKEKEYDQDAKQITSQEVLHEIPESPPNDEVHNETVQQHRFGSVLDLKPSRSPTNDAGTPQLRTSVLSSLGYLRPLIEKSVFKVPHLVHMDLTDRIADLLI